MVKSTITTTINGKSIKSYVAEVRAATKAGTKSNLKVRNEVLRYLSDFISQKGQFKEPTGATKNLFENPAAAPDIQGSAAAFENFFGVSVQPTSLSGANTPYAFVEVKQKISSSTQTTVTSKQLPSTSLESFEKFTGIEPGVNASGEITYKNKNINTMSSEELKQFIITDPALEKTLLITATQKFENYLFINYLDKRHNNKPFTYIVPNASNLLQLTSIMSPYIDLSARQTKSKSKQALGINIQVKLSKKGEQLLEKHAIDITDKFHKSLGKHASSSFIRYAVKRLESSDIKDQAGFIKDVITLANEFAEGSDTPIIIETKIPKATSGVITTKVRYAIKKDNKQKFISSVQLTALTQARLKDTMRKSGIATPPDFTERSGRFRKSVNVAVDYRRNLMIYNYNPLYERNMAYGYQPDEQVSGAVRYVAQQAFARQFNIVKG